MDWYLISVLVFVAILALLVYKDRKKFTRESIFLLRRTKKGRDLIIKIGTRFKRGWKFVGYVSVATGFVVSALGLKMLIDNAIKSFTTKTMVPGLGLVLPSPTSEPILGYGFFGVPFWYWIICISLLALVHEGLHGIFTAREGARIKSLGFGILAIIPLAFVEPDEKQLEKKGVWPQLRVFSAGSFANFLLAGVTLLVLIWMTTTVSFPAGANFQTYPVSNINLASIGRLGNYPVSSIEDINKTLDNFGQNDTIEIRTANNTFYLKKSLFLQQLNQSEKPDMIMVFQDFPAAKAGLEGTIIKINGQEIKDPIDLSLALEKAGPNQTIQITTKKGDKVRMFTMMTVERPPAGKYSPDTGIYFFAALEHVIPGSVEFYQKMGESWAGFLGQRTEMTWAHIRYQIQLWEWVSENYPLLHGTAAHKIESWENRLDKHPEPGFIGIANILPNYELRAALVPYKGPIDFLQGLFFFLFFINLGVGVFNLLPLFPLDGEKIWKVVLRRYLPKYAGTIMRVVGILTLFIIIANFIPFGALL